MKSSNLKSLHLYLLASISFLVLGIMYAKRIFIERNYEMDTVSIDYLFLISVSLLIVTIVYLFSILISKNKKASIKKSNSKMNTILILAFWSTLSFCLGAYLVDVFTSPTSNKVNIILMINFYQFLFFLMFVEVVTLGMLKAFTKKEEK